MHGSIPGVLIRDRASGDGLASFPISRVCLCRRSRLSILSVFKGARGIDMNGDRDFEVLMRLFPAGGWVVGFYEVLCFFAA